MKWRIVVFWLLLFAGLCFFFMSFGFFAFQQQEEVQLFIPEWAVIREILFVPGGFCTVAGEALVQYYSSPSFAVFVTSSLICLTGLLCYLLLQEIAPHRYNLLLALFPVGRLMKVHITPFYVLDGTIGICLMLLFLYGFIRIRRPNLQLLYGLLCTLVLYGLAGQLVALCGMMAVVLNLLCRREKGYYAVAVCLLSLALTGISIRYAIGIPLTDGIYSERYQESQLQPDSYMYYVWIRFTVLLAILFIAAFLLRNIPLIKRSIKIAVTSSVAIALLFFLTFCMPELRDIENDRLEELSALEQQSDWDTIIRMHHEKEIKSYITLNYLNMALARKGVLGDRLFHYSQKGPQSLLTSWDRSYYVSCLLSDIHYMIGDISLSEGYAMEGLTLAKRGGSPRMLQRLVKVSLIRRDFALANKYIALLSRLPNYRLWAEKYKDYLSSPEKVEEDKELSAKIYPSSRPDDLLCLIDTDSLWMGHLEGATTNRIAWEYLGCSYLLAKEMGQFKSLLLSTKRYSEGRPLPIHFQEAALVLAVEDRSILDTVSIRPEVLQRYKQFQKEISKVKNNSGGLLELHRQYGDTFWFYYYCKKLNG